MLSVNFSHIPLGQDPSLKAVRQECSADRSLGCKQQILNSEYRVCNSVVEMIAEQEESCDHHLNPT